MNTIEHRCFIDFHVPTLVPRYRLLQQLTFQDLKDLLEGSQGSWDAPQSHCSSSQVPSGNLT